MSTFETLHEINTTVSRIMGQQSVLHIGLTADVDEGVICLDEFEIRDGKGVAIVTKMANTITHNIACTLEDSKHNGTYYKVVRHQNDFQISCNGTRGLQVCLSGIKREVEKMLETVKKCKADIKKMADQFGTETIQHVLLNNQRAVLR
jgi:hypothetical protein